jgi:hypothetical protein
MNPDIEHLKALGQILKTTIAALARRADDQKKQIDKLACIQSEIQYAITREYVLD